MLLANQIKKFIPRSIGGQITATVTAGFAFGFCLWAVETMAAPVKPEVKACQYQWVLAIITKDNPAIRNTRSVWKRLCCEPDAIIGFTSCPNPPKYDIPSPFVLINVEAD